MKSFQEVLFEILKNFSVYLPNKTIQLKVNNYADGIIMEIKGTLQCHLLHPSYKFIT